MFDQERYRQEVLDPARKNQNTPPADLFIRYGIDTDRLPRGEQFDAHLAAVVKYWQSLSQKITYRRLVEALNAAHKALQQARQLTVEHFAAERDRLSAEVGRKLDEAVEDLAAGGPVVAASTVAKVAARLSGAVAESQLRELLSKRRVRVVDELWPLPEAMPAKSRDVTRSVRILGLPLSLYAVAGEKIGDGFTLRAGLRVADGPLTVAMFDDAKARAERRAQDDRKTATENLLTNLRAAFDQGTLEQLVLWELIEVLAPAAELPMASVRRVAREATQLGLKREEAEELALAVLMRGAAATQARRDPAGEVDELLGGGSLRAAERLLGTLPAGETGEVRARVEAVAKRVTALASQAQKEIAAGRPEHAAELLTAALRDAADDSDLAGRLRALAPPSVPAVTAGTAAGDRVAIGWTPSPARTGGVTYQVVRTRRRPAGSATDGDVVGRTDGNELADSAAPAGDDLYYTVFASRSDGVWSAGASAGPVALLPEVTGLTVTAGETDVRVGWTARADASAFSVVREPGGTPVSATRTGFTEDGLSPDHEYRYLVRAGYPGSRGAVVQSAGVTLAVTPQSPPKAVPDLAVEPLPGQDPGRLRLVWTPPASGQVSLRSAAHRPRWQRGAEISEAELSGYGEQLAGHAEPATNDRAALAVPMPAGRVFVTAFSAGGGRVAVGPTVSVTNTVPVTRLAARRVGDRVRLSWEWPSGVALARVRWWPAETGADARAEETDCWLRSYRDDGGLEIVTGPGAVHVAVATVSRDAEGESVGSPVTVLVTSVGVPVSYRFVERGVPFRRRTRVELSCEQPCSLPDLVVVQSPGRVAPLRPEQGTAVARVPAQRLDPGRPLSVDVAVRAARGPYRLGCFVDDHAGAGAAVVLMGIPGGH